MTVERRAARALLLAGESVLLIKGVDPALHDATPWWITPGGGVIDGESVEGAAAREILEETGLQVDPRQLGPIVATRLAEFDFEGRHFRQSECFFALKVERFTPHDRGWDDVEQRALLDTRWWTVDELVATNETVYPIELPDLVRAVLDHEVREPIELSGA